MAKKESEKSKKQVNTKFIDFITFLKKEKFKLQKDNPDHRPGHGYGPSQYIEWDIDNVAKDFLRERFIGAGSDYSDEIKKIFNIANKALSELGYVNILKAFELRKFAWVNGCNVIEILTNHNCSKIHIDIKKP